MESDLLETNYRKTAKEGDQNRSIVRIVECSSFFEKIDECLRDKFDFVSKSPEVASLL